MLGHGVDTAVRAARLIGRGLYGVDIKSNERGVFVIEVNDNPTLVHEVEDAAERDEVWRRLAGWFLKRLQGEELASVGLPLMAAKAG